MKGSLIIIVLLFVVSSYAVPIAKYLVSALIIHQYVLEALIVCLIALVLGVVQLSLK